MTKTPSKVYYNRKITLLARPRSYFFKSTFQIPVAVISENTRGRTQRKELNSKNQTQNVFG
jgi:hypothetical protein